MIGGWSLAGALQEGFQPVRETISALAASSAEHPQVMTAGLAVTGVCHVVTAAGLRRAALPGRVLLGLGGVGTAAVAALPVDAWPRLHGAAAAVAFIALAVWPAAAWRPGRPAGPGLLARGPAVGAAAVLVGLLVWFVLELQHATPADGGLTGLAERALAGAQSAWPLAVALSLRLDRGPSARGRR